MFTRQEILRVANETITDWLSQYSHFGRFIEEGWPQVLSIQSERSELKERGFEARITMVIKAKEHGTISFEGTHCRGYGGVINRLREVHPEHFKNTPYYWFANAFLRHFSLAILEGEYNMDFDAWMRLPESLAQ